MCSAYFRAMGNPIPVPRGLPRPPRFVVTRGRKMRSLSSACTPGPVSITSIRKVSPVRRAPTTDGEEEEDVLSRELVAREDLAPTGAHVGDDLVGEEVVAEERIPESVPERFVAEQ